MKHITTYTTTRSRAGMSVLLFESIFIDGFQHHCDTLDFNIVTPAFNRDNKLIMRLDVVKRANCPDPAGVAWSGDCASKLLGKIL